MCRNRRQQSFTFIHYYGKHYDFVSLVGVMFVQSIVYQRHERTVGLTPVEPTLKLNKSW